MHTSLGVVALSVVVSLATTEPTTAMQTGKPGETWVLTEPKRRAPDAPPAAPPSLPADAHSIAPTTFDIVVRPGPATKDRLAVRQTVSRTADRIHVMGRDGREWLFERNPIDPRRVSGTLVEHRAKVLVLYEETDLRMVLGIRGWADVLALGVDRQAFAIEHVKPGVDATLLRPALERFPKYRVVDLAEWLEK